MEGNCEERRERRHMMQSRNKTEFDPQKGFPNYNTREGLSRERSTDFERRGVAPTKARATIVFETTKDSSNS